MRALAVVASALLLTGCFKIDMQLDVSSDDTVDGEMVFAVSRDVSAMAESMGEDPDDLLSGEIDDLPEGTRAEEYEDDDFVGQRYVFDDVPLSEFDQNGTFSITHEGDEIVVGGNLDLTDMDPEAMAEEFDGEEMPFGDLSGMMDSMDLRVAITFPGEVTEHNGELDGTTVTWTPVAGETNEINARSADSGGGGGGDGIPVWIWIVVVAVVLGLAGLLFFLSRNRNQAPPAEEATVGAVPPPPPGPAADTAPVQPTTPLPTTPPPPEAEPGEGDQPEPPAPPR
ncbi:hypothetical protein SAMN04515669_5807 [Jiangella sp. DSM 45060]|nr:hypothetical protein SAMN04515669_5807 [Jiangella sp. DSM 45060]